MNYKETLINIKNFLWTTIWIFDTSNSQKGAKTRMISWLKTFMLAVRVFNRKDMWGQDIPALTYSSLMALIPFLALMFVIAKGFGCDLLLEEWINQTLASQPVVAEYLVGFVHNYLANTQSQYIVGVGILMMFYTLYTLMMKIERAFDNVWQVRERGLAKMFTDYTTLFFMFGIMIVMASGTYVVFESLLTSFGKETGLTITTDIILRLGVLIPLSGFFIFIYVFIPNTYIKVRSVIVPSILAGVSMHVLQFAYFYIQGWLSSYNVIYGSLAALPLFLMWLQFTWAICMFCAVLCYTNQNLHHFDYDADYRLLCLSERYKVCAITLHHICKRFKEGKEAYTARDIHQLTGLPQQIINGAISNLIDVNLIVEIRAMSKGLQEEQAQLQPAEHITNITIGELIERLSQNGEKLLEHDLDQGRSAQWRLLADFNTNYLTKAKNIMVSEI